MIRRFAPNDYAMLEKWWADWEHPGVPFEMLPPTGFINEHAAAFLLKTERIFCFVDCLVGSRGASHTVRGAALDAVIEACVEHAKEQGFQIVYALTDINSVKQRSIRLGFEPIGQYQLLQRSV